MCLELQKIGQCRFLPHHLERDHYSINLLPAECPSFISDGKSLPFLLPLFLLLQIQNNTEIVYAEKQ